MLSVSAEMYSYMQTFQDVKRALNFRMGRCDMYFMGDNNQNLNNSSLAKAMVTTFHASGIQLRVTPTLFRHSIVTLLSGLFPEVLGDLAETMKHSPKMQQTIYNNAKKFGKVSRMSEIIFHTMHGLRVEDNMLEKVDGEVDEVYLQELRERILPASRLQQLRELEGHPPRLSIQGPSTSVAAVAHPEPKYDPGREVAVLINKPFLRGDNLDKVLKLYQEHCHKELVSWVQCSKSYNKTLGQELHAGDEVATGMVENAEVMDVQRIMSYFSKEFEYPVPNVKLDIHETH